MSAPDFKISPSMELYSAMQSSCMYHLFSVVVVLIVVVIVVVYFLIYFRTPLSLAVNLGCLSGVRHSSCKTSATHSYQCVQYFRVTKQLYGCQCLGFLMCTQMLMHAIAHGGCVDTVRESALKVDSGRKIPCHTRDFNLCWYCAWLFSQTLYPLSYPWPRCLLW